MRIRKLHLVARAYVINFMREIDNLNVVDACNVDFENEVCVHELDVLQEHISDREGHSDGL